MVLQDRSAQMGLIVGVSFALLMSKIDSSIVNISLPVISREFNITISQASWIVISYLLILTCTLLFWIPDFHLQEVVRRVYHPGGRLWYLW